ESKNPIARRHALWGLGMIGWYSEGPAEECVFKLARDADPEIRTTAIRLLGKYCPGPVSGLVEEKMRQQYTAAVREAMVDPEPRVRFAAAVAYGTIGPRGDPITYPGSEQEFYAPLFDLLKSNNDTDPYLRHAAVVGLVAKAGNPADLWNV